ncbi:endo-beta-N-acetylglucosaminidase H [Pedobacter steynii]|uniref:endo-beta-N-acetylglucosaminidase H n=1 Tax=Pedobacter steynii TaxID=430522 RepID=UPI000A60CEE7|nr:endo-beta-N-acetylglucosaminidase H [Pedobacter steynii]
MMNKKNMLNSLVAVVTAGLLFSACTKDGPVDGTDVTAPSTATAKTGPISVCYVEVNNNNILNVGNYTLKNGGQQLFDIAIIFAANINYNTTTKKAVLFNNDKVTKVLSNKATYIKPLQDKGIKVLLSILGNHQGAGFCNFTSRASAKEFAQQLSNAVTTYNLDGIDFDDEYAEYGVNGTTQPNDSSFVMLVQELRKLMPTKLITFYYYGPAASRVQWNGQRVGDNVNYSWNANYGSFSAPNVPPMGKAVLGPAAVWINHTSASTAKSLAQSTKNQGYGVYLAYDLPGTNMATYLSSFSTVLYGDSVKLSSPLQSWP